jgi:hypothetical protein
LDVVLGVSMAPRTIHMVLVEGENADGLTVDEDCFGVDDVSEAPTLSASDQVIAAILGTREGAGEGGHQLTSTGVTWTNPRDAAALATALAARKVENVMLVSAFLAAAALAQTVGQAIGYEHIAMLFVEPDTATLAVIDSTDGSIADVQRRRLRSDSPLPELIAMIAGLHRPEIPAQGLFVVGCDVDVAPIKPALDAASYLPVSVPEEPDTALARGAALASANAPLFASSTAALAYAQDPGTGEIDPYAVSPGYLAVPVYRAGGQLREEDLAYSAVPDQDADAHTGVVTVAETAESRRPLMLVGSVMAVVVVSAALALEIALALGIRPAVALRPTPGHALIVPAQVAPAPSAAPILSVPHPTAVHAAPPPALHLPARAPVAVPAPAPAPIPAPVPVIVPPIHGGIPAPSVRVPLEPPRVNLAVPRLQPPLGREPVPQIRPPAPPFRGQLPRSPMTPQFPQGPRFPQGPGFGQGPRFPQGPGFGQGPRFPTMPGPRLPSMPGPMVPRMPMLPHFPFPGFRF